MAEAADDHPLPSPVDALRKAKTEEEFDEKHLEALRSTCAVDTNRFEIPKSPGIIGRLMFRVRKCLWRLLRYQHDWMAFHQNEINSQVAAALEFEKKSRDKKLRNLEARIEQLEEREGKL